MGSLKKRLKRAKGIHGGGDIGPYRDRLDTLRHKMLNAKDLPEIMNYFFDELAESSGFMDLGSKVKRPLLKEILKETAKQGGFSGQLSKMLVIKLPDYPMVHGPVFVDGFVGTFIYYEDIRTGILYVSRSDKGTGEYMRITVLTEAEADSLRSVQ